MDLRWEMDRPNGGYLMHGLKRVAWVHEFPERSGGRSKFGLFNPSRTHGEQYMRDTLEEAKAAAEAAVREDLSYAPALHPGLWELIDRMQRHNIDITPEGIAMLLFDTDASPHVVAYLVALVQHGRQLLDAARPKCKRCDGALMVVPCPDCNDSGWAS
jgi:hypothetical protein